MIGYLKGELKSIQDNSVLLTSNGIGFVVNMNPSNLSIGQEVEVYTHMVVRENDISLWGFVNLNELTLFRLLISVSGIGPRTAQSLINTVGVNDIIVSIKNNTPANLKTSGVGQKSAQKIILELKNKISDFENVEPSEGMPSIENSLKDEVVMALIALGYREGDVRNVVTKIMIENPDLDDPQSILKIVLRNI